MNWLATQFGSESVSEFEPPSPFGGIQWNAPDWERTLPKISEWCKPLQAAASPPRLQPVTTVCRGSAVKLYRLCAQGRSSELRKSANTGLHASSRSRPPVTLSIRSATIAGMRFAEIRLLRMVG